MWAEADDVKRKCRMEDFVGNAEWVTAFAHQWRDDAHINELEATTAYLGLEWAASMGIHDMRVLIFSDSLVTVYALQKERSSSNALALPCRRFAALAVAHGITPALFHILSKLNPADHPSRVLTKPTINATHQ
ncbi:hypothetical protein FGB62_18g45 [Gracilaria domingensis]|nr:hypothetical protein FGB62_18g45 [Gracilaria domingensis]